MTYYKRSGVEPGTKRAPYRPRGYPKYQPNIGLVIAVALIFAFIAIVKFIF